MAENVFYPGTICTLNGKAVVGCYYRDETIVLPVGYDALVFLGIVYILKDQNTQEEVFSFHFTKIEYASHSISITE